MNARQLLQQLKEGDETRRIEAKRSSEMGKAVMETVSAFSNEPELGGGFLLLGVVRDEDTLFTPVYKVEGVPDPDRLSADLATQCASMLNVPIRPIIEREEIDGKSVLVVFIPEAPPEQKPIYLVSRGLPKGACRRIGSTDQRCTDEDLAEFYRARSLQAYDGQTLDGTTPYDYSSQALENYRRERRQRDPDAPELKWDDHGLLRSLGAIREDSRGDIRFTVAGLLLYGADHVLRQHFPVARVDYIRVQGRIWIPDARDRFSSLDLSGPLFEIIYRIEAAIMDDLPVAFSLPEGSLHRVDKPLIPRNVIREALANALMHRDYRANSPVQIIRYTNRIEFRNAGYSLKPEEELGKPGSFLRNPSLAAILHQTRIAETKGSGVATMRRLMHEADLQPPTFVSNRDQNSFVATLFLLHFLTSENLQWLAHFDNLNLTREEKQSLVLVRETGTITNAEYRNLNDVETLAASAALRRLRDAGLLEQHEKGSATFYTPTEFLLTTIDEAKKQEFASKKQELVSKKQELDAKRQELPEEIQRQMDALKKRVPGHVIEALILDLCRLGDWTADELARLLDRKQEYLLRIYLTPLLRRDLLQYTRPNPNDPEQAYRAK